jgi:hypothetical protein
MLRLQIPSIVCLLLAFPITVFGQVDLDLSGYAADCSVVIRPDGDRLDIVWPLGDGDKGRLVLQLKSGEPLIELLGILPSGADAVEKLLRGVDPQVWLTVGSRNTPPGQPPDRPWFVFFDKPAERQHDVYCARLTTKRVRVSGRGRRGTVAINELVAGAFIGSLELTFYAGSPMMHVEAVMSSPEDGRAILYDAGLVGSESDWKQIAWLDKAGQMCQTPAANAGPARPLEVRHRTIVATTENGSIACFPPPHQFFFPRDWTNNFQFAWFGHGYGEDDRSAQNNRFGFGIRNDKAGGGAFVPWFNAPPGSRQRLGVFYLISRATPDKVLEETLRFTRNDKFDELPGYITLTSHWHMAVAVSAMERNFEGTPDFVRIFKEMGVNAVHLADFHGDGHQFDAGPIRLEELDALFKECRRLSDDKLLLIPGEEVNTYLGLNEPGKHPGHWMSLFPKPVYWILKREPSQPFVEQHPKYGKVYRVGSREDVSRLLNEEGGLVWSAHPRIKASSWTPDIFRHEDFYLNDSWLGGAWKAMPADLSHERLGERALDLLDDMANWAQKKYLLGEVDVFKIDRTHELFGHMNINYVRLDELPSFDNGWRSLLDAVRAGRFFVTTGEVLIRRFNVGGKESGQTLELAGNTTGAASEPASLEVELNWTFPLRFAEVVSGDGEHVYRERIDLTDTPPFGTRTITLQPDLRGRTWVRFQVWDVACNGAFTQPVWLEHKQPSK